MSISNKGARAVADVTDGLILATIDIGVPPERVFQAITASTEIVRWWGSDDSYRTEAWTSDFRVGGRWKGTGRSADGSAFTVEGEFLEIDPPRKVVQTWRPDWDQGEVTKVTYLLEAIDGGTRLMVRHEGFGNRADSCRGHAEGWEGVLGWLDAHVSAATVAGPAPRFFFCRLIPPRPTFPADISEAEAKVMREHAAYCAESIKRGLGIVFGPVADPNGTWGAGIIKMRDEAAARDFIASDPAARSGLGFRYELLPMLSAIAP